MRKAHEGKGSRDSVPGIGGLIAKGVQRSKSKKRFSLSLEEVFSKLTTSNSSEHKEPTPRPISSGASPVTAG
eukprot:2740604-Rhodomonas_salina.1